MKLKEFITKLLELETSKTENLPVYVEGLEENPQFCTNKVKDVVLIENDQDEIVVTYE